MSLNGALQGAFGNGRFHILMLILLGTTAFQYGLSLRKFDILINSRSFECNDPHLASFSRVLWVDKEDFDINDDSFISQAQRKRGQMKQCYALVTSGRSNSTFACSRWRFSRLARNGPVSDANTSCHSAHFSWVMLLLTFLGFLLLAGADFVSRRMLLHCLVFVNFCLSLSQPFLPSGVPLLGVNIATCVLSSNHILALCILLEMLPTKRGGRFGAIFLVAVPVGYLTALGLSFALKNMVHLDIICLIPFVFYLPLLKLLPESPYWLVARGRFDDASESIRYIAKCNGVTDISAESCPRNLREECWFAATDRDSIVRLMCSKRPILLVISTLLLALIVGAGIAHPMVGVMSWAFEPFAMDAIRYSILLFATVGVIMDASDDEGACVAMTGGFMLATMFQGGQTATLALSFVYSILTFSIFSSFAALAHGVVKVSFILLALRNFPTKSRLFGCAFSLFIFECMQIPGLIIYQLLFQIGWYLMGILFFFAYAVAGIFFRLVTTPVQPMPQSASHIAEQYTSTPSDPQEFEK